MAASRSVKVKPIVALGWHGMNNLPQPPWPLVDQQGHATPHFAVNCDVEDSGLIKRASGYASFLALPGVHSLGGEELGLSVLLAVAGGILYRVDGNTPTPLTSIGSDAPVNYAEINFKVYCASLFWKGVYNLLTGKMEPWGLPLPGAAPDVSLIPGNLPPGKYSLTYTRFSGSSLSGNGPIRQIEFQDQAQGLQLNNLEDDFLCWITQVNGGPLFLAEVSSSQITSQVPDFNPFRSLNIVPPPCFSHFAFAHGRMWGVNGRNLYYSEPNEFGDIGWFSRKSVTFLEDLVMVAPYTTGLYVSSLKSTWVFQGTEPGKQKLERVGNGAIPGTLTYAKIPASLAGGAVPTREFADMSMMPTPVWRSPTSFVIGTHGGHLTLLTERRLKLSTRQQGASLYRMREGVPQIISSAWGMAQGEDAETHVIFKDGKLFELPMDIPGTVGLVLGVNLSS